MTTPEQAPEQTPNPYEAQDPAVQTDRVAEAQSVDNPAVADPDAPDDGEALPFDDDNHGGDDEGTDQGTDGGA